MEPSQPSFGRDLTDQLSRIETVVHDHIAFYSDVRDYFKERAALERQYGASLQAIVKKATERRTKREEALSVGPEPIKPWDGTSCTLNTAWSKILSEADDEASNHTQLADSLQNEVCEVLKTAEKKKETTRKKHVEYAVKLLAERDKLYNEKAKAKQRYDEACASVESTRVKQGQAKDDRHMEKVAKSMDAHMNDMMSLKNAYLLSIAVANEAQKRFYGVDLPSLQDDFQSIWSLTTCKLATLLKTTATLNGRYLDAIRSHNEHFLTAVTTINSASDQALFVEFNQRPFSEPLEFVFEPCTIWHDTADFALSSPEPKVLLQNRLGQDRSKASDLEPAIQAKRHEIMGLEKLREAYSQNESLGDPDEVVENLLESVRQTITLELQYTVLTKEIEVLEQTLGDDQGSQRPHTFKSASFVTPTPCCFCNSNIWGIAKQGVTCKACSIHAHVKCGPKVPSNCPGSVTQHSKRPPSVAPSSATSPRYPTESLSVTQQGISPLSRAVSTSTRPSPASNGGLSRAATTVTAGMAPSIHRHTASPSLPKARMMYEYEAATAFEVSVPESEIVTVIAEDDGSGWIKVETSTKQRGLVPASYVEMLKSTPAPAPGPKPNSARAKQAKALYDWDAQAPDEHSLVAGETVTLTANGDAYGEGWYEITKEGRKGIIPSNYVEIF